MTGPMTRLAAIRAWRRRNRRPASLAPHPLTVFMLGMATAIGVLVFVSGPESAGRLNTELPGFGVRVWAVCLIVGGLLGLAGNYRARWDLFDGLMLEVASAIALVPACVLYAAMVITAVGFGIASTLGIAFVVAFAAAEVARVWQIRRFLAAVRRGEVVEAPHG